MTSDLCAPAAPGHEVDLASLTLEQLRKHSLFSITGSTQFKTVLALNGTIPTC